MSKIPNELGLELGHTYLENITTKIKPVGKFENIVWQARIKTKCRQIKYYGNYIFIEYYQRSFIASTEFGPPVIIAVDERGNDILIFDGCKQGYDNLFNHYNWKDDVIKNRIVSQNLFTRNHSSFEVIISAFYDKDFDGMFKGELNSKGICEFDNGLCIELDKIKRDGFCFFEVMIEEEGDKPSPIFHSETC